MATRSTSAADDKNRIQTYQKMMDVLACFSTIDRQLVDLRGTVIHGKG